LTQDRPEEFKLYRLNPPARAEPDDFERRRFVNIVALFAMLALVVVSYWVFHALDHSRRFQQCLDSGRRNCVDFVNPSK
jgi:hypothetical protein